MLAGRHTRRSAPPAGETSDAASLAERDQRIAQEVDRVADELRVSSAQVALAWLRGRGPDVVPIVGTGHVEQLRDVLGGLELRLEEEHLGRLDAVSRVELGFPHDFLAKPAVRQGLYGPLERLIDLPPEAQTQRAQEAPTMATPDAVPGTEILLPPHGDGQ